MFVCHLQSQEPCTNTRVFLSAQLEDREEQLAEFDNKRTGLESRTVPSKRMLL